MMPDSMLGALREAAMWPEADHVIRLVAALILGGLIGLEREVRDKPAGLRTIILICVGACLFTILSQIIGSPDLNSTRIAAQIVTGIGFLGAGVILRARGGVYGLTTAATIWAVAAVGMAAGFGQLALAAFGAAVILVALLVLDGIERWIGQRWDIQEYHIVTPNTKHVFEEVAAIFANAKLKPRKQTCYEEGSELVFHVVAMGTKANHDRTRMLLAASQKYTLRKP